MNLDDDSTQAILADHNNGLHRREFHRATLGTLLTWSLLDTLFTQNAFSRDVAPLAGKWLADLNSMSSDLKEKKLQPLQWHASVEALLSQVDLPEILKFIDFENLTRNVKKQERGEVSLKATLPLSLIHI